MNKILTLLVVFFGFQLAIAGDTTPPPPPDAPLPPGSPIDGNIMALFIAALLIGYFLSVKYTFSKKGSL
jgi:hypothetical protein